MSGPFDSGPTNAVAMAPPPPSRTARRYLRLAWVSLAALPVSIVGAMVLGDWLLTVQGYESGGEELVPLGAALSAGTPALLVLILPTIPAIWFGLRARRLGLATGLVPAIIGAVIAGAAVLQNMAALIVGRLLG